MTPERLLVRLEWEAEGEEDFLEALRVFNGEKKAYEEFEREKLRKGLKDLEPNRRILKKELTGLREGILGRDNQGRVKQLGDVLREELATQEGKRQAFETEKERARADGVAKAVRDVEKQTKIQQVLAEQAMAFENPVRHMEEFMELKHPGVVERARASNSYKARAKEYKELAVVAANKPSVKNLEAARKAKGWLDEEGKDLLGKHGLTKWQNEYKVKKDDAVVEYNANLFAVMAAQNKAKAKEHGLPTGEGLDRLKVSMGSMKAGNDSTMLRNNASRTLMNLVDSGKMSEGEAMAMFKKVWR